MEIVITKWALNSYLELKRENVFTAEEYNLKLRPDTMLLKIYPNDPKFTQSKFWSPVNDRKGKLIHDGYKMKWHQIGNGLVQLRLTVAVATVTCFLCESYVKTSESVDKRKLAKFKIHIQLLRNGRYTSRGKLT